MQNRFEKFGIKNNLFLAPLAGFSTPEFRLICEELGVGLTFTEMVSAKGLYYSSENTAEYLFSYPTQLVKACQIFGNDPYFLRWAAESDYLKDFKIVDINMGCPVPKIYGNGEGSYLLNDFNLAQTIIREVKKSGKITSVKFRVGDKNNKIVASDFAKMCEDSGADFITIHGRTREMYYSGEPMYDVIQKARESVSIPVIGNGGIFDVKTANKMFSTGVDGIMIARGALENPFVICDILGTKSNMNIKDIMLKQVKLTYDRFGDRAAVVLRKCLAFYLKGIKNSKKIKEKIFAFTKCKDLIDCIEEIELDYET